MYDANFQVLSIQQLYRISTMYWDDKYGTHTVSSEVILFGLILLVKFSNIHLLLGQAVDLLYFFISLSLNIVFVHAQMLIGHLKYEDNDDRRLE